MTKFFMYISHIRLPDAEVLQLKAFIEWLNKRAYDVT